MIKRELEKKNPVTNKTVCSICDFPLNPHTENGWFNHVVNAEHLFLRNIYSPSELKTMSIDDIGDYKESLYRLLNIFTDFEVALQDGEPSEEVINVIREDLCSVYDTFNSLREDIEKIPLPKKPISDKQDFFHEKMIAFLYSNSIFVLYD